MAKSTFGAGCFWGVESAFRQVKGVTDAAVGYAGGTMKNPTYQDVCTDRTGHAEVVQLDFDPAQISYEDLVRYFFEIHDPTTLNRQGNDRGSQYRSSIFFHSKKQEKLAQKSKAELEKSGKFAGRRIVTEIVPAQEFWKAEEYHQKYLMKKGLESCHV